MNLCIDIGNTMVKMAVFSHDKIAGRIDLPGCNYGEIMSFASRFGQISNVIISSVRVDDGGLSAVLNQNFATFINLDENTPLPFANLYETGRTLGKDRIAAVAGANNNYPGRNVLVIDAGTAITYDIIDENSRYLGGNISPGMMMRFRALHHFTGKLPLVSPEPDVPLFANNTTGAIAAGVQNGILFEIESYIDRLDKQFADLVVILTGGDAKFFDKKLKSTIFVDPDLILSGLNRILIYNVKNR